MHREDQENRTKPPQNNNKDSPKSITNLDNHFPRSLASDKMP